jgi:hypothetical protein
MDGMSAVDKVKDTIKKNNQNVLIYAGFITVSLLVYYFLSDGDFSFYLTYASFCRCFGVSLLVFCIFTAKTASGVSLKTLELYGITFFFRLISISIHQGYLPFDKTGDWFYHFLEIMALIVMVVLIFAVGKLYRSTYDEKFDSFGNYLLPDAFGALYLAVPCLLLALLLHPSLNDNFFTDTCWCFSMYLESVSIFPQLYMFQKQSSSSSSWAIEQLTSHFTFAIGFARIVEMIFWMRSYRELVTESGSSMVGNVVLFSQVLQFILMADFFYYYLSSLRKGGPMQLPTHI